MLIHDSTIPSGQRDSLDKVNMYVCLVIMHDSAKAEGRSIVDEPGEG